MLCTDDCRTSCTTSWRDLEDGPSSTTPTCKYLFIKDQFSFSCCLVGGFSFMEPELVEIRVRMWSLVDVDISHRAVKADQRIIDQSEKDSGAISADSSQIKCLTWCSVFCAQVFAGVLLPGSVSVLHHQRVWEEFRGRPLHPGKPSSSLFDSSVVRKSEQHNLVVIRRRDLVLFLNSGSNAVSWQLCRQERYVCSS